MMVSQQISRYGAYGLLIAGSKVLLTQKKSGPYVGKWGLPGGGIEFGESPEEALIREFREETALDIQNFKLKTIASATSDYIRNERPTTFHHVGILFKIETYAFLEDYFPEEEGVWMEISSLKPQDLTPFACKVLC